MFDRPQAVAESGQPAWAQWVPRLMRELEMLSELPEDWDSYGAQRVSATARERCTDLLTCSASSGMPRPALVPTSKGGLQLEWMGEGYYLEAEVYPDGAVVYVVEQDRKFEQPAWLSLGT